MDRATRINEAQVAMLSFCFNQLKAESGMHKLSWFR